MLRNIFSKLPGFKAKAECTVSSSCRSVRSVSPESRYTKANGRKPEDVRVVKKRAHSFPSLIPQPCNLLERGQHNSLYKQYKNFSYRGHREDHDDVSTKSEEPVKHPDKQADQDDACYFDSYDIRQYELEAARPKERSNKVRNEIERQHREKSVFFPNLQPSNLRPFGSRDNVLYNPIMLKPTTSFKIHSNNFLETSKEENVDEAGGTVKMKSKKNQPYARKFSTISNTKILDDIFQNQISKASAKEGKKSKALKDSLTEDFQGFQNKLALEGVPVKREVTIGKSIEEDIVLRFPSYSEFVKKTKPGPNKRQKLNVVYPTAESEPAPQTTENCPVGEAQKDCKLLNVNQDLLPKRNLSKSSLNEKSTKVSGVPLSGQIRNTCNACERYKEQKRREKEEKEGKPKPKKKRRERRPMEPRPCDGEDTCGRQAKSAADVVSAKSDILLSAIQKSERPITPELCLAAQTQKGRRLLSLERELPSKRSICMNRDVGSKKAPSSAVPSRNTCNACERLKDQRQKEKDEKLGKNAKKFIPDRMQRALEPKVCVEPDRVPRKVCLPSKIRLQPPECTPKPFYDCKKPPPCPPRADDCLKPKKKKLPKLVDSSCPCIEPYVPDKAPQLPRLPMKLCDPPRICPVEDCLFRSRADDGLKVKRKTLKPLIPKDCPCVEPPKMIDVPLKRLKPHCPPEVCRPVRVCPPPPCDETLRADYCLKVKPKKLPHLSPKECPCIPDPPMKPGPKMRRLNLKVPEPCRVCPEPCICYVDCPRADDGLQVKPKKLPKIIPGDCPCIPEKFTDVPLKRLKCKDEEYECVVPDPCKEFPRADWGCWEYDQVEWVEVDEKCIEKKIDPCNPPSPEVDPCKKLGAGSKLGTRHMPFKRGYGTNSNSSLHLFYKLKYLSQIKNENQTKPLVSEELEKEPEIEPEIEPKEIKAIEKTTSATSLDELLNKKKAADAKKTASTVDLIKLLNDPDRESDNPYLFPPPKSKKITIDSILSKINDNTTALEQNKSNSKLRSLSVPCIKSQNRMISTTNFLGKKKSDNSVPKKKSYKKACPKFPRDKKCKVKHPSACAPPPDTVEGCVKYRTPICCEKTQSPYNAFSEVMEREIAPFTKTSQWTCDRKEYGFDPHDKKFNEMCVKNAKDKKKYSTDATLNSTREFISRLPIDEIVNPEVQEEKSTYKNLGKEIFEIYKAKKDDGIVKEKVRDHTPTLAYKPIDKRYSQLVRQKSLVPGNQPEGIKEQNFGISSSKLLVTPKVKDGIFTRNCLSQIPKDQRRSTVTKASTAKLTPSRTPLSSKCDMRDPRCAIKPPQKKKDCKKETCKKFKLGKCPPSAPPRRCLPYRELPKEECKKPKAPFPAFSDCLCEEMEEMLSECPYEREKLSRLQPRLIDPVERPHISPPPPPYQGKIDPSKEEDCIRDKLCLKKKGLSQTCANFGEFIKPLRSKDYFKHVDPDCMKLEEMKKRQAATGNSKYKQRRERKRFFSTMCLEDTFSDIPRRRYSSSSLTMFDLKKLFGSDASATKQKQNLEGGVRRIYIRNYHALCKTPEMNYMEDIDKKLKEVSQSHFAEFDENTCKLLKLRNVQWRINNFKKWDNLNKSCTISKTVRRFYNSSRNKFESYVKKKEFSTATKTIATNQESVSEPCVQRGLSTNVSLLKPNDSDSCKIKLKKKEKQKFGRPDCAKTPRKKIRVCAKFSLPHCSPVAKRGPKCQDPTPSKPCKKTLSPYQSFSDCHKPEKSDVINHCPIVQENIRNLQPKYTVLPEIESTATTYPSQPKLDPQMEIDYVRCKLGVANEGLSQTCEDFGQPVRFIKCKDLQKPVDSDCTALEEKKKREDCYREEKQKGTKKGTLALLKKKLEECGASGASNMCMYRDQIPEDDCSDQHSKSASDESCKIEEETLWRKICNYFKARPNCPAPDEWKKKALREKAEKAAAAAGLCLIDPKDLKKYEEEDSCDGSDKSLESIETIESDGSCDEPKPSRKGSSEKNSMCMPKRQYSTLVLRRCYSRNLNQKNIDDINRILEEEEMKQRQRAIGASSEYDSEPELDVLLLKNKNKMLARLEDEFEGLGIENYHKDCEDVLDVAPCENIMPSRENIIENILQIYADDSNRYQEAKAFAALQEVAHKLEHFKAVPSFEEIENLKTQSLVNELNKLLKEKEDTNKEE